MHVQQTNHQIRPSSPVVTTIKPPPQTTITTTAEIIVSGPVCPCPSYSTFYKFNSCVRVDRPTRTSRQPQPNPNHSPCPTPASNSRPLRHPRPAFVAVSRGQAKPAPPHVSVGYPLSRETRGVGRTRSRRSTVAAPPPETNHRPHLRLSAWPPSFSVSPTC
ncbi:pollen-specific leucine-rich repeat extensin-like protein 4 [Iris pallida]|uniref:Pollen-specific leucine-rich repeat extensin-like protein 4 n=1 Tax=Iris pallida TaxID=29817 RepID=A0AAX6DVU2_IRIPA|nr:pollen-specific leucine-rich repeat extensin-like protein 4 [Iris pallida]